MTLILPLILSCSDEPPEEVQIAEASHQVTWESAAMLGPHRYEASVARTEYGRESVEHMTVRWGDWDSFEVERRKDGALRARVLFIQGEAWQGDEDRMRRTDNVQLYRRELATSWNLWEDALSPYLYVLKMEKTGETVVEGRPALTYSVSMDSTDDLPGSGHTPLTLSGTVTVDEGTAVRLLADVEGTYQTRSGDERKVVLKLQRSEIGVVPELQEP